jgi:hypothetical protein
MDSERSALMNRQNHRRAGRVAPGRKFGADFLQWLSEKCGGFSDMAELTRRADKDHKQSWSVYYGDVRVGHIGIRAGVPNNADQWSWSCGFNPGCDRGEQKHGTGKTFEDARAGFQAAWDILRPKKTEAHFELWRHERDMTAWKYRMWKEKCSMPSQTTTGTSQCFCGSEITLASIPKHVREAHRGIGDERGGGV